MNNLEEMTALSCEKQPDGFGKIELSRIPQIDRTILDGVPIYVRICDIFYHLVENGIANAGDQLPGENLLAEHWNVSRATVRQAFRHLEEDGLVYKRQGKGTVIAFNASHLHHSLPWCYNICLENCIEQIDSVEMKSYVEMCGEYLADRLEATPGKELQIMDFFYRSQDEIMGTSVLMVMVEKLKYFGINPENRDDLYRFGQEGIYSFAATAQSFMTAFGANADKNMKMTVPKNDVVLFLEEIMRDEKDQPIGYARYYLRSSCYRIPINRRAVMAY